MLTAYGHDLARLAASIADELELSGEVINRLLRPGRSEASLGAQQGSSGDERSPERAAAQASGDARNY